MSRRKSGQSLRQISEINMTPLMDLTFILLITFIITFPLIEQGIPISLPKGKTRELSEKTARTVSVDAQGKIYLDNSPLTIEELEQILTTLGSTAPDVTVMLRADEVLPYKQVVDVLKVLNRAKISRMALVTQEE